MSKVSSETRLVKFSELNPGDAFSRCICEGRVLLKIDSVWGEHRGRLRSTYNCVYIEDGTLGYQVDDEIMMIIKVLILTSRMVENEISLPSGHSGSRPLYERI